MAYFPNGSAGMDFMEQFCSNCVNWRDNGSGSEGCYVMDLHTLWNYSACNGKDAPENSEKHVQWIALEHFIRTSKDGLYAEECKMFVSKTDDGIVVDKTQALIEWEALYGKRAE